MNIVYFIFNFGLGEEIDMLCQYVYYFVKSEIVFFVEYVDISNQFFNVLWFKLGEMGLLGVIVSE